MASINYDELAVSLPMQYFHCKIYRIKINRIPAGSRAAALGADIVLVLLMQMRTDEIKPVKCETGLHTDNSVPTYLHKSFIFQLPILGKTGLSKHLIFLFLVTTKQRSEFFL